MGLGVTGRVSGSWSHGHMKVIVSLLALPLVSQETLRAFRAEDQRALTFNLSTLAHIGKKPQGTRREAHRPVSTYLGEG